MKVCAITNVYNEAFNLPIWLKHYGAQVGIENCIVVDHGSDDGSTDDLLGAGRINIPRATFSDHIRAQLISSLATAMLQTYDAVIYSDCDEFLVADPERYADLRAFAGAMSGPVATAIGLNVVHNLVNEGPYSNSAPILAQRRHVMFVSPMCKTLIVRRPVTWGGGFHSSSEAPSFGDLYLFHMRWVDLGECLKRLAITRGVQFSDTGAGPHHRAAYLDFIKNFQGFATRNVTESFSFEPYLNRLLPTFEKQSDGLFRTNADVRSDDLHLIPDRFSTTI